MAAQATFTGSNYTITVADGSETVNGHECYAGQLIIEHPQGIEVFDTFDELVESHPICEQARSTFADETPDYSTVADNIFSYKFATDSEHGTIMARDFTEAKSELDKMLQDCDGGFGWVEDHDGERYESQSVCYRFENGKLYKLDGAAYVHCFSSPHATTEEEAIRLYKKSQQ